MAKQQGLRSEFEEDRLIALAKELKYQAWTRALIVQRVEALDRKLAAGDVPILDGAVTAVMEREQDDSATEDDAFAAFFDDA